MGARRRLFASLAAVAVAIGVAAAGCGVGDDEDTTTAASRGAQRGILTDEAKRAELRERVERALEERKGSLPGGHSGGGSVDEGTTETAAPEPSGPAPTPSGSLPNEGTNRVAPGVPTTKGSDNSVQEFGVEARSEERVRAAQVLQAYLAFRAARDWARACSYLSASVKAGLKRIRGKAQGEGSKPSGCAETMRTLLAGAPRSAPRSAADIRVLSLRVRGTQALLLYRDGKGTPSVIPMAREGGEWKVAAALGGALPSAGGT